MSKPPVYVDAAGEFAVNAEHPRVKAKQEIAQLDADHARQNADRYPKKLSNETISDLKAREARGTLNAMATFPEMFSPASHAKKRELVEQMLQIGKYDPTSPTYDPQRDATD